jgi:hypothetical protein
MTRHCWLALPASSICACSSCRSTPGPSITFRLLKRALLDAVADDAGAQRVGDLRYKLGVSLRDPIVHQWLSSLRPALTVGSSEISGVYADHVALAFASHMARAYGDMRVVKFRCAAD